MTPEHPLPEEVEKAIHRFAAACESWGWQADQGHNGDDIAASSAEYIAAGAALRSAISSALAAKAGEG